jgi:hypothetical protein
VTADTGDLSLADPELTRSASIKLNDRVSLRRADEILSSSQSGGIEPTPHVPAMRTRAIRGRCFLIGGSGPA